MHPVLKIILAIAGIAIVVTIAGGAVEILGSGDGPSTAEKQAQVEHSIKRGLERRAAKAEERASVRRVTCVQGDSSHYECLARAQIGGEVASVLIAATSDDKHFVWHVVEVDEEAGAKDSAEGGPSAERLPSPESLVWAQVTCGEVRHAVAERDDSWLATAGEAVAVSAVAMRPDADAERLAVAGARDLVVICRRASNPAYRPYTHAYAALMSGRRP